MGEETTNKLTDGNESCIDNSCEQRDTQSIPLPPPPPPPPTPPGGDIDTDMGHGSTHIPLYEGDEDLDDTGSSVSQYGRPIKLRVKNDRWHNSLVLYEKEH